MLASRAAWGIAAGGLVAVSALAWLLAARGGVDAPPAREDAAERERLRAELDAARDRNQQLAAENEWLQAQVDLLTGRIGTGHSEAPAPAGGSEAEESADAAGSAAEGKAAAGATAAVVFGENSKAEGSQGDGDLWFDDAALLEAGVQPYEVERLRDVFNSSEMQLIELENQAQREGWYRRPRYWQALSELRTGLRENIGDEDFDLLLYATGRKNRVVIDAVLGDSPGERAGLAPGDIVLSYDGRRIFKAPELKQATVQGQVGDRVAIDVLRNGERVRIYVARGPLGARLSNKKMLPEIQ